MPYYFFAASLPMLAIESPPSLSFERFLLLCDEYLSGADRRALADLMAPDRGPSASRFVHGWRNRDTQIRNAAARHRSGARANAEPFPREQEGVDLRIQKSVADAFARPSPLDRELALDRLRWQIVEELAGFDPFAAPAILAYAIKIRLAERWAAMNHEQGRHNAEQIVNRNPPVPPG